MLQGFPIFAISGAMFETEAQRFIDAANLTNSTHKTAINNLVRAAKTNGWWNKCIAIYPIIGGTADTHKWNLKDPRDSNDAFRLTMGSGWTHASTGMTANGTSNAYAHTHVLPARDMVLDDTHISVYSTVEVGGTSSTDMGCLEDPYPGGAVSSITMYINRTASGGFITDHYGYPTNRLSATANGTQGWYLSTRTTNNVLKAWKNGTIQMGSTLTTESATLPIAATIIFGGIHWWNSGLYSYVPSTKEFAFVTVGAGISDALASTMYTDIQNYQTTLGRNV